MKNIFLLGECMIELMSSSSNQMKQSFAGDVFNTAVYLKRTFSDVNVNLVTAVGKDTFSLDMIQYFNDEHINTDFVFQSDNKIPGLYAIQLDDTGERSFIYWRENSAARKVMDFLHESFTNAFSEGDIFFFSGISLAVIEPEARDRFWQQLTQLKTAGVQIVFDPNYRARMWKDEDEAKAAFDKAFTFSDIALPGVDDFESLYGINTVQGIVDFCQPYSINELVVKNGPASVVTLCDGKHEEHKIVPVETVIDTTSAGDAFNGIYLGARLNNNTVPDSVAKAAKAAGFVIQHKGAIVPKTIYAEFSDEYLN